MDKPDKKQKHKRRQFISNPRVQVKIILVFAFLAALYAVTDYYVAKSTLWSLSAEVQQLPLSDANRADVALIIQQQGATLDIQLILFTALTLIVMTLGGVFMSHRLGGPIHQLENYLRDVGAGRVKPRRIRFRKDDFFHELAESFNEFQSGQGMIAQADEADADDSPGQDG